MCQVIKIYYVPDVGANEVLIQHPDSFDELLLGVDTQAVLLQYTGLQDKNGKEIYEGHIVDYGFKVVDGTELYKGRIFMEDGMYLVDGDNVHNESHLVCKCSYLKVIGNIYENKELLDGK